MLLNIAIIADADIVYTLKTFAADDSFHVGYAKGDYPRDHESLPGADTDVLIAQAFPSFARFQDMILMIQSRRDLPDILLFEKTQDQEIRFTTTKGDSIDAVAKIFETALSGSYRCIRRPFSCNFGDYENEAVPYETIRQNAMKELLRGSTAKECRELCTKYELDLKENGYYLFFWELQPIENKNHSSHKHIFNFLGYLLLQACRNILDGYAGGEIIYMTNNQMCVIANDPLQKNNAAKSSDLAMLKQQLSVPAGCCIALRYFSDRIDRLVDLRGAYEQYCTEKSRAFFRRGIDVLEPSDLAIQKNNSDMEEINTLLLSISNRIQYDIHDPSLEEDLRNLYIILKNAADYILYYYSIAVICSDLSRISVDFNEKNLMENISPDLLRYSSIEEQLELMLDRVRICREQFPANRRGGGTLLLEAMNYIALNYDREIGVADIAGTLHISKVYLSQIFKRKLGIGVIKYLNDYRIIMAKKMLEETDDAIYLIAESVGFGEYRNFSKTFKKHLGVSPGEYRKQIRS